MTIKEFKKSLRNHTLEELNATREDLEKSITINHSKSEIIYLMIVNDLIFKKKELKRS